MTEETSRLVAILAAHVSDERVLDAIASVPRELFVPPALRDRAYANHALPIGSGQTISQPLVVARMAELAEVAPDDRVLDIGTGSGYHAAVLARLAKHVWSIERVPELSERASAGLAAADVQNVTCLVADGAAGLPGEAPFDVVNVAAAAPPSAFDPLLAQLAPGGRLVAPLVRRSGQHLALARRPLDAGPCRWTTFEAVRFVPLIADPGELSE